MKVALLIDAWFPYWGGGQVNAWEISRRLVQSATRSTSSGRACKVQNYNSKLEVGKGLNRGIEIDVFTRRLKGGDGEVPLPVEEFEDGKLRVFRLGPVAVVFNWPVRIWWMVAVVFKVIFEHLRQPYDVIHAHANSAILPGKVLSVLLGKPLVITVHGVNVLETEPKSLTARVEKWLLTGIRADEVISVQEHLKDFSSVHRKITVIPNGVDVAEYEEVKTRKSRVFKIVWVGRFQKVKGLEVLLRALARIRENELGISRKVKKSFELHLVGGGGDSRYEKEIKELVRELGLSEVVKFKGVITGMEKIKELKSAHIFVLPSLSEGQPVTLLEAWAARLPVVVTRAGDNSRMVKNGINGWLVEPGDVEGLTQALEKAMRMYEKELEKTGRAGYELVKEEYSWERVAEGVGEVYERVVGA